MKDLRMSLNAYFYFSQGYYYGAGYFACMKLSSPESHRGIVNFPILKKNQFIKGDSVSLPFLLS